MEPLPELGASAPIAERVGPPQRTATTTEHTGHLVIGIESLAGQHRLAAVRTWRAGWVRKQTPRLLMLPTKPSGRRLPLAAATHPNRPDPASTDTNRTPHGYAAGWVAPHICSPIPARLSESRRFWRGERRKAAGHAPRAAGLRFAHTPPYRDESLSGLGWLRVGLSGSLPYAGRGA